MAQNIAGSIRTDVTADTSQFDSAMKRAADAMEASVSRMNASRKKLDVAGMMSKAAVRPSPELAGVDPGAISVGVGVFGALHSTQARQHAASEASARSHAEVMLKVQAELSRGQYSQIVKERQQIESEYARSRAELLADLKADIQQRHAVKSAAAAAERGLLTAQRQEMETHAQSLRNIQMAMLKEDIQSRFAHAAQSKSIRDNDWNDEREQLRQMAALRVDIIARGEDAALREMLQADVESRVMRDNEHNDIMAKLRQEAAFREDLRTRLAPGRNMTSLMSQRNTSDSIVTGMSSAGKEQRRYAEQLEQQLEREERTRHARVLDLKQRQREQNIAAERAMLNQQQALHRAALEQQIAAERAAAERRNQIQNDVIRVNRRRYANDTIQAIRDANDRRIESRQFRPNANMSDDMERAARMVERLRGELDPLVGIQQNIAQRAMEYRREIMGAVIAGRMNNAEAQRNIAAYDVLLNQLRQRNEAEHRSFLGMRRMGFAAQQLGYAIEDAASQFGTMGLAGAFRAAGNNITAAAAVMGVWAGVAGSLAAAAISIGISIWNAKKKTEDVKKVEEDRKQLFEKMIELQGRYRVNLERIAAIEHARRLDALQDLAENQRQEAGAADDQRRALEQHRPVDLLTERIEKKKQELLDLQKSKQVDFTGGWVSTWVQRVNPATLLAQELKKGGVVDRAAQYAKQRSINQEIADLEKQRLQIETDITGEIEHQNSVIAQTAQRAQERNKLFQQAQEAAAHEISEIGRAEMSQLDIQQRLRKVQMDRNDLAERQYEWESQEVEGLDEAIKLMQEEVELRNKLFELQEAERKSAREHAGNVAKARGEMFAAIFDRNQRLEEIRNPQVDTVQSLREEYAQLDEDLRAIWSRRFVDQQALNDGAERHAGILQEQLGIEERIAALKKQQAEATRDVNDMVRGQFENLNPELARHNKLVKERTEFYARLDATRLSAAEKQRKAAEFERGVGLNEQVRVNDNRIAAFQEQQQKLESDLSRVAGIPTVMSATTRGDESRRMIEQEKLRLRSQGEQEPMVKAIGQVKDEIRKLREDNKQIQNQVPPVAAMF